MCTWLVYRLVTNNQIRLGLPGWIQGNPEIVVALGMILDDVVGAGQTKREAIDSMNLFLASETFQREMGGNARRGVLFEGVPGTGKTYLAKATAAEAGVPFLFVSGVSPRIPQDTNRRGPVRIASNRVAPPAISSS